MTPLEALTAHLDARPIQPCPVHEMTPEQYAGWSHALARWTNTRDRLQSEVDTGRFRMIFERKAPTCLPKSDYIYREPMPRKRKRAA
jgi:hypothetical protein